MPCLLTLKKGVRSGKDYTLSFNRMLTDDEVNAIWELIKGKLSSDYSPELDKSIQQFVDDKPPSIMKE